MSTTDRLNELVAAGELSQWSSAHQPVTKVRRGFWVTREVKGVLERNPWPTGFFETASGASDRRLRTHAMINQFVEGNNLTVGNGKEDVDIKCLKPILRVADWRVWTFRPWKDRRLTRIFGEFASPNNFVALAVIPRRLIIDWDKAAGAVDARWLLLFPGEPPLHWNVPPQPADVGTNFSHV